MTGGQSGGGRSGAWRLVALACAAFLLVSEGARFLERREMGALRGEVQAARRDAQAALAAVIAPETLLAANASVYLIVVDGAPRGTAFVIDREAGILVTAAHTAESLPLGKPGARIHLVNRETRDPIRVRGARLHAGYGTFRDFVESYQPMRKSSSVYAPQVAPIRDLAFDAALLFVDAADPETGANRLGPALRIASEEKLRGLNAGSAIAVIGYPYDVLDDGFIQDSAVPRIERGVIAAMIAPLDSAREDRNPDIANLLIHRLATAGGNSGSPIIDAAGEVVAIHTHGIELPSSNADSAAQRADVIYDLLSTDRELKRLNEIFKPAWLQTMRHWARGEEALAWSFFYEYERPGIEPAPTLGDIDYGAAPFDRQARRLTFDAAVEEFRLEAPDLAGVEGAPNIDGSPGFVIREPGEFAVEWISVERARPTVLYAFDYSLRARSGFCRLTIFWRKRGETRLMVQRSRPSFELQLPLAAAGVEDYQIIYRRDRDCDPASRNFTAGSIAWTPEAKPVAANAQAGGKAARGVLHTARAAIVRMFACGRSGAAANGDCVDAEYVDLDAGSGQSAPPQD